MPQQYLKPGYFYIDYISMWYSVSPILLNLFTNTEHLLYSH